MFGEIAFGETLPGLEENFHRDITILRDLDFNDLADFRRIGDRADRPLFRFEDFDALVLDLVLPDGGAIAISDFATYRYPDVPIIAVTCISFF